MKDGEIIQVGRPEDLVTRPATDYVAEFTRDVSVVQGADGRLGHDAGLRRRTGRPGRGHRGGGQLRIAGCWRRVSRWQ